MLFKIPWATQNTLVGPQAMSLTSMLYMLKTIINVHSEWLLLGIMFDY